MHLLLFLLFAVSSANLLPTSRCFFVKHDDSGNNAVRTEGEYCFIKKQTGSVEYLYGASQTYEQPFYTFKKELHPCSTKRSASPTSLPDCFNPDQNTLCCRGDYCNFMTSLNCAEVHVPKKCPSSEVLSTQITMRGCPATTKTCAYRYSKTGFPKATYDCGDFFCDEDNKMGCSDEKIGSEVYKSLCCKPIDEQLSLDWGKEALREWRASNENKNEEPTAKGPTRNGDLRGGRRYGQWNFCEPKHAHTAFLFVLMMIF